MQILFAWKSAGLSDVDAVERWTTLLETWRKTYQPLVDRPLQLAVAHVGTLFLGLIYVPEMFAEWQEFYQDDGYAVAWAGISHNLLDTFPEKQSTQMNTNFLAQLQQGGDRFLRALDGRFIVSVLHRAMRSLRIITNNAGLTPCFQTEGPYGIAIGTRIAPLLDLVGRKRVLDRAGLIQTFALDWCLGSRTSFEGVFQVEPGMELLLQDEHAALQEHCYFPAQLILERAKTLKTLAHEDCLKIGSDAVNLTIQQQMRHAKVSLMDLTGGHDSRAVVASAVALGYPQECSMSGIPHSKEIEIASKLAEVMHLKLHCLYPGAHYAENLEESLRLWSLWTEGMSPAFINFAQSAMALSPELRKFYAPYYQVFSGVGADYRHNTFYGTEMLVEHLSNNAVIEKIFDRRVRKRANRAAFLTAHDHRFIKDEIRNIITVAIQLGLTGYQLIDYFYWRERAARWGGYMLDMQQFGRHLFAPLCQQHLTAVFFAMTLKENLAGDWHCYHINRMMPSIAAIPLMTPPSLSGVRKRILESVLDRHLLFQVCYRSLGSMKRSLLQHTFRTIPEREKDKLGAYFHPYLQTLLFSGQEWWPNIIPYEKGRQIWEDFVSGKEAILLWNLATIELWARSFLI